MTAPRLITHVGQTLYYVPRRGDARNLTVEKIGRIWAHAGSGWYRVDVKTLEIDALNAGRCYLSEAHFKEVTETYALWRRMIRSYEYSPPPNATPQAIRQAAALLGIELEAKP